MRAHGRRWWQRLRTYLSLETLEARTPVSEGIGPALTLSALGSLAHAYSAPPPHLTQLPSRFNELSAVATDRRTPWQAAAPARPQRAASSATRLPQPAPSETAPRPALNLPGLKDDLFAALELVPLDLVSAPPHSEQPPVHFLETGNSAPALSFDAGTGSAVPPDAAGVSGSAGGASGGPSFVASNAASPDAASLLALMNFLPPGGGSGGSGNQQGQSTGPGAGGGGGGGGELNDLKRDPPGGRGRHNNDPLWVLDANNGLVLTSGETIHDFSGWTVDLYAQVSGVSLSQTDYKWNLSGAPDATGVTITNGYHLHFTWATFSCPTHCQDDTNQTISVTTDVGQSPTTQTFYFTVYSQSSPAWSANNTRPPAPTLPLLVPPDAVKPDQETIGCQPYCLGEQTGEVMTHFALPSYHPAVAPLQLDYSSLAANPRPIFTEYYQLSQQPSTGSTVTATLKLNGVTQGTSTYDTHLLNLGDILDIALQGDATGLSTGRYPYEIDVTENGNAQPAQTGSVDIVNLSGSQFGAGWTLDNLDQIIPATGGIMLAKPSGDSLWFASGGNCGGQGVTSYVTPAGDFSCLTWNGTAQSYTLTAKDGTQFNFNSSGYQTSIFDQLKYRTTSFTWTAGQLTGVTDFLGNVLTLAYDANGKLKTITDPAVVPTTGLNRKTQFGYGANHTQLTQITEPDPGYSEPIPTLGYSYDAANKLNTETDPDGNVTTFAYSSLSGRISTVTRADQSTESLTPQQASGLVASGDETATLAVQAGAAYTDPRGKNWFDALDWSGFGHGTEHFDPLVDEMVIHRDNNGLPWLYEDPLDRATRNFFDNLGNTTKDALPDGNFEQASYNSISQLNWFTDANGHTVTIGYGPSAARCRCAQSVTQPPVGNPPQSPVDGYSWSDNGFLNNQTDPNGFIYTYNYDGFARVGSFIEPNDSGTPSTNPTVTFGYNSENYLTSVEDQLSHTTSYNVDNLGRVLTIQLPTGGVITMTYDAAGNQTSVTDPTPLASGTDITQLHYDAMNRVDRVTDPDNLVTTYGYDAAGNIQDIFERDTLPSGNHQDQHFIYDDAGRLINEQWKDGSTVDYTATYGYDAASEMTSASDNNSAYSFGYDARGRQISVDNANTLNIPHVVLTSVYDAVGNRTEVMDSLNPSGTITFGYDADNRLTGITMNVTGASDHPVVTLQYDQDANLTSISRSTSSAGNQVNTALGYTHRNLVQSITDTSSTGNVTLAAYTYGYDAAHNLQTQSEYDNVANVTLSFTDSYDALNQLTGVSASTMAYNESYSYTNAQNQDLNGNRASASFGSTNQTYGAPAPDNRLTTDGQYTYAYDNQGNLTSKWGSEGGVLTTYSYSWDFRNRMTSASVNRGGTTTTDNFTYDVFDRRIGKLTQGGTQQWTVYDGDNAYADFSGTTLTTRYVFANGPDEIVARTNASGNSTAWYLTDNIGSVRQIVDANGNNLYHVNYFTFGGIVPGSESGTGGDRFKFAGREWDSEIGLYYNRARYYDPNTGRFNSEDPSGFSAGDSNLYRYVFNGPTTLTDPTGHVVDSVSVSCRHDPALCAWLAAQGLGDAVGAGAANVAGAVGKAGLATIAICKGISILHSDASNGDQESPADGLIDKAIEDIEEELDELQKQWDEAFMEHMQGIKDNSSETKKITEAMRKLWEELKMWRGIKGQGL